MVFGSSCTGSHRFVISLLYFAVSLLLKWFLPVIWTKSNPTPWNTIKPDEGTKIMAVNQKFDKKYACQFAFVEDCSLTRLFLAGLATRCRECFFFITPVL